MHGAVCVLYDMRVVCKGSGVLMNYWSRSTTTFSVFCVSQVDIFCTASPSKRDGSCWRQETRNQISTSNLELRFSGL
jgi:hypothetical protein